MSEKNPLGLSYEDFRDLAKYAISRLDGAWMRAVATKHGMDDASALDIEVWEDWMERITKVARKKLGLEGRGIEHAREDFPKIQALVSDLMGNTTETDFPADGTIVSRVTQCTFWENTKKAGLDQFALAGQLCSGVHVASYKGMLKGMFPGQKFELTHTKRIPAGEACCEVVIKIRKKREK